MTCDVALVIDWGGALEMLFKPFTKGQMMPLFWVMCSLSLGATRRFLIVLPPPQRQRVTQKSSTIYRYKCDRVECDEEYIGESARTFGERFEEHLKCSSPIYDHSNITGHNTTLDNFSIVGQEDQNLMRLIKEAMYIRANNPLLNKNIGKCHLPHIWDDILNNITELKLK